MPLAGMPSVKRQIGLPRVSEGLLPPQRREVLQKSLFLQNLRADRRGDANPFGGFETCDVLKGF